MAKSADYLLIDGDGRTTLVIIENKFHVLVRARLARKDNVTCFLSLAKIGGLSITQIFLQVFAPNFYLVMRSFSMIFQCSNIKCKGEWLSSILPPFILVDRRWKHGFTGRFAVFVNLSPNQFLPVIGGEFYQIIFICPCIRAGGDFPLIFS